MLISTLIYIDDLGGQMVRYVLKKMQKIYIFLQIEMSIYNINHLDKYRILTIIKLYLGFDTTISSIIL